MNDKASSLLAGLKNATDGGPWYEGSVGERIAIRISSTDTNGAYAIVESVAIPDCNVPLHLHRNEEEHLVVLIGTYRIQTEDKIFNAPAGTSVTIPKGARHSWRNISHETSHLLVVLTPGGFEKCIQTIRDSPADKILEVAAQHGCFLVGPPVSRLDLIDIGRFQAVSEGGQEEGCAVQSMIAAINRMYSGECSKSEVSRGAELNAWI